MIVGRRPAMKTQGCTKKRNPARSSDIRGIIRLQAVHFSVMLAMLLLLWWPKHNETTPFHWHWSIIGVSIFLSTADFMYFYSLSLPDAMISIVSMIRRGSVIVSFLFGAAFFHEKNLKAKAFDLALVLLGMIFLYIGSK